MIPYLKSLLQDTPKPIGSLLAHIPYRFRPGIGRPYVQHIQTIDVFEKSGVQQKKAFIVSEFKKLLHEAMSIPFYKELYASLGAPNDVSNFSDIAELPIIRKEMLRAVPLENRSYRMPGRYIANTGGSSGAPLDFYITPQLIPIEWAHMHTIWAKLGYKQAMLKLIFGGRNLGEKSLAYDGLRHSYTINVYKGFGDLLPALRKITKTEVFSYLHGYPSALAEFADNCAQQAPDVVEILRQTLKGAFLGSEFPAPIYRDRIESVFGISTVSWYGHTERAILAWEKNEKFIYHPFQTYWYCEVIPNDETGGWRLIGTSYGNFASPFIRYDTGDDVEPVEMHDGLLVSFRIRSGRLGEFVLDRHGAKIPLTALVFGRHHRLFDIAKFIQVRQVKDGRMTVVVTLKDKLPPGFVFAEWFDNSGLDMDIQLEIVEKPILSSAGKVTLKVQ
jgi:phenylacetate-CoA ligase